MNFIEPIIRTAGVFNAKGFKVHDLRAHSKHWELKCSVWKYKSK